MSGDFSEGVPKKQDTSPPPREELDDEDGPDLEALARPSAEDRTTAVLSHWGGLLTWFLVPLILYLTQRDRRSLAAWHAREAFNFQSTLTIYYALGLPMICLMGIDPKLGLVPIAFELAVTLFELVVIVWASVAAYHGERFRCPLTIPFILRSQLPFDTDEYVDRE